MIATTSSRNLESTDPLSADIERFLLARGGWVPVNEICLQFGVKERQLRQVDNIPGLCTAYAISSSQYGLKHVAIATESEWLRFKIGTRRGSVGQLRRIKVLSRKRANTIRVLRSGIFEKDTGQGLFPGVST